MNLIALLIGLVIERLATQLFHWRRMRRLERFIDSALLRLQTARQWPAFLLVALLVAALALPVLLAMVALGDTLLGFPYLILSIVVLFFSLGPEDIGEDVDAYCAALEAGDEQAVHKRARALIEGDVPYNPLARCLAVESAVFVQANNRLFAVLFWFVILGPFGPLGAWAYRVTDLVRRRAVLGAGTHATAASDSADGDDDEDNEEDNEEDNDSELRSPPALMAQRIRDAAVSLHALCVWIPARLTATGYAVAGHFDAAMQVWRAPLTDDDNTPAEDSEALLARVGTGALALPEDDDEELTSRAVRGATAANRLVFRLLLIWVVIIAALTLYGWTL